MDGDRILIHRSALPDPSDLFRLVRAVPHKAPDGTVDGFRVSGLRPDSPFARMGFANGDVVHEVAGVELTSVQQGMEMWQAILEAETEVERLEAIANDPTTMADHQQSATAFAALSEAQSRVQSLYARWSELEAIQSGEG